MATTGTNMFFQLKVRLNIHISLTGMSHQMVFIFCAHILRSHFKFTYSVAFSENHGSVTFSENRKSNDVSQNVKLFSETSFDL